ncbi:DUF6703 family protein [Microbispora sp. ATCC PTA-5024]|uniref:DUF6703 family protein n=1 Tax=Microbispora sp. ATCC PTA-5024 TaxID=316330 RepID=UPI0003DB7D67|nr:DUF6703 family protein [Microbispora sp. ATCC PTA-5024]ETK35937.1 hypothetical protein MPTA5024_11500 [Microbispora sp. ATCC PTA-5024]
MARDSDPTRRPKAPAHPLARKPAPGTAGARPARPARRPLPAGEQFFTPGATGLRRSVELKSATPLVFLFQLPRWVVPVAMVALLLAGLVVADWRGGIAVLPVLAFVLWLAYLSWPSLRPAGRLLRVALVTFIVLLAATRFGLI